MIGHALSQAGHDLLIGFLVITAISAVGTTLWCIALTLGERYAARHPLPPAHFDTGDFERELAESLRVIGGSKGPEGRDREAT